MTDASTTMEMPPPSSAHSKFERALPRRRFFSDMPDKGLFGFVALLGFTIILVLKVKGYDADYVAVFAVLLMIVYGALAFNLQAVQMRLDRLGDNFYYLGFIFTLASLSAALLQLRAGVQVEELLGSFGIALITTIVGIAGRVMFVQLRSEVDDVEEQVRRDLAVASADLRTQLSTSVREFETFRTGLLQTLRETIEEFAEEKMKRDERIDAHTRTATQKLADVSHQLQNELTETIRELAASRAKFTKASQKHADKIEELTNSAAERLDQAFEANLRHAQEVSEAVYSIAKTSEIVAQHLAGLELPSERFTGEFSRFVHQLEELAGYSAIRINRPRRHFWHWFRFGRAAR